MARLNRHQATLLITLATSMVLVFAFGEIRQDPSYHNFADQRTFVGIANFLDVVSNLPFVLVGLFGLVHCWRQELVIASYSWPVVFAGLILVGFGSGYYHLNPTDSTLVWDRLPMAVSFMGLLIALLSENINSRLDQRMLIPAILVGLASVLYWRITGDLRPYIWVQVVPLLTMLIVLLFFRDRHTHTIYLMIGLLMYLLAKVAEIGDDTVYGMTGEQLSGHTLKHLLAAGGAYAVLLWLKVRKFQGGQLNE